jgi:hypothetical protein
MNGELIGFVGLSGFVAGRIAVDGFLWETDPLRHGRIAGSGSGRFIQDAPGHGGDLICAQYIAAV